MASVSVSPEAPPPPVPPAKSSAWPLVLGILGLIFGAGALLGAISGLALYVFRGPFVRMTAPDMEAEMLAFYDRWAPFTVGFSVAAMILAVLLIFGCIALLRRRRKAVALLRTWAFGKILYALVSLVWMIPLQKESFALQQETMARTSGGVPPGMSSFMGVWESAAPVIAVFQACWLAVLPVIILILFATRKIKQETSAWS